MNTEFTNAPTKAMYQHIKETHPLPLINEATEAKTGYIGLKGLAAEVKAEYSERFKQEFSEAEFAQIDWQQIVAMLATLGQ
ncbi:hypothetical protein [Oceanisphaera avium]|uniref:Uncharacterized protein n=1 Tax=Oceanisphaera avium TaxID=1903694 RepID=A0A1Y0CYL9_9GAMM|nr:hypothetical protein [Oceanisphaera avium]ART80114.1 hypothetical protein CBP12_08110 [Oceanisphaera avium]